MQVSNFLIILTSAFIVLLSSPAYAMSDENKAQFRITMGMSLNQLGQESAGLLDRKHPNTDWSSYNFPDFVFEDLATEVAYKVAVKNQSLLGAANISDEKIVIPCYCTCDSFGHANLLYCFYKNGAPGEGFDEHGAQCAVCIRQALLAFLWDDLGATHEEIMAGMKEKFAPLIEKYHQHEH
jgi:hypothetical protein